MLSVNRKLKRAFEDLNIEVAVDKFNNKPPEGSLDAIIEDVEQNVEVAKANEENASQDTDKSLPDLGDDNSSDDNVDSPADSGDSVSDSDEQSAETTTETTEKSQETKEDKQESDKDSDDDLDSPKGDNASDQAQTAGDKADEAESTAAALEEIAEILEQSAEIGGLDPQSADIVSVSVNAVTNPLGVAVESIDPQLFNSYSKRYKYTLEAIDDIKQKAKDIGIKIIEFIKKMMRLIKEAYRFYKSELFAEKAKYDAIKNVYSSGGLKVEAYNDKLQGVLSNILLTGKDNSSDAVITAVEGTHHVLLNYINAYRKDLTTAVAAFDDLKEKVFNIDLADESNELQRFKREDLAQFGQFFGIHLTGQFNQVKSVKEIQKPSDTIAVFESPILSGQYRYVVFTANKANINTDDILKSQVKLMAVGEPVEVPDEIAVCEYTDFRQLFQVIDQMFILNRRIGESVDYAEKELAKLLDYAEAFNGRINKMISNKLEKMGSETNQLHGQQLFNSLVNTVRRFYIEPIEQTLRYSNRFTKAMISYAGQSIKQYQ